MPPVLYALVQAGPLPALWVALLFLGIQQFEGHVVVPNVMGRSLRLHPLLVIFGLLAGGEIYGFPGILVALPLLAAGKAAWEFFHERVELEPWTDGAPLQDVEVDSSRRRPIRRPLRHRRTLPRVSAFPVTRLRRFRRTASLRGLVRETTLSLDQFVMPLFVAPESLANEALPGMARFGSSTGFVREVERSSPPACVP